MLGKTFKGMTDEMLRWQTERFPSSRPTTHDTTGRRHVRPEQVVEIAFDGLQRSTRYPGGLALRFARVVRYRDDKPASRPTRSTECGTATGSPDLLQHRVAHAYTDRMATRHPRATVDARRPPHAARARKRRSSRRPGALRLRAVRDAQIEEIANAVGINRAIVYRHFTGKEELFALTLVGYLDELKESMVAAAAHGDPRTGSPASSARSWTTAWPTRPSSTAHRR